MGGFASAKMRTMVAEDGACEDLGAICVGAGAWGCGGRLAGVGCGRLGGPGGRRWGFGVGATVDWQCHPVLSLTTLGPCVNQKAFLTLLPWLPPRSFAPRLIRLDPF